MESGFFAALAGFSGKLAFQDFSTDVILQKAPFIALMLIFNAMMMSSFVKALANNALKAQTVNFATNFLVSALIGFVFFGEQEIFKGTWVLGAALMVLGVFLVKGDGENGGKKDE